MLTGIECPKCGKKTLIQRKNDLYQCLDCDFRKDFSEPPPPKLDAQTVLWYLLIAAISFLLLTQGTNSTLDTPTPLAQPIPESNAFQTSRN